MKRCNVVTLLARGLAFADCLVTSNGPPTCCVMQPSHSLKHSQICIKVDPCFHRSEVTRTQCNRDRRFSHVASSAVVPSDQKVCRCQLHIIMCTLCPPNTMILTAIVWEMPSLAHLDTLLIHFDTQSNFPSNCATFTSIVFLSTRVSLPRPCCTAAL